MLIYYTLYILYVKAFNHPGHHHRKRLRLLYLFSFDFDWVGQLTKLSGPAAGVWSHLAALSYIYWSSGTISHRLTASALFCGGIFCPAFTLNLQSYEQLAGRFQHLQISQAVVRGMFSYWRELYEAQSLEERFTQKWNMPSFTRPHVAPNANDFIFFCGTQEEDFWREFSLKELSSSRNGCRSSSVANLGDLSPHSNFPIVPATFKDAVFCGY